MASVLADVPTKAGTPSGKQIERVAEKLWDIVAEEIENGNEMCARLMQRAMREARRGGSVRGEPL